MVANGLLSGCSGRKPRTQGFDSRKPVSYGDRSSQLLPRPFKNSKSKDGSEGRRLFKREDRRGAETGLNRARWSANPPPRKGCGIPATLTLYWELVQVRQVHIASTKNAWVPSFQCLPSHDRNSGGNPPQFPEASASSRPSAPGIHSAPHRAGGESGPANVVGALDALERRAPRGMVRSLRCSPRQRGGRSVHLLRCGTYWSSG